MPALVDFRGRLTLAFIKKITVNYCPLYTRPMNNRALYAQPFTIFSFSHIQRKVQ